MKNKNNTNEENKDVEDKSELYSLSNLSNYKEIIIDDINILYISFVRIIHNFVLHSLENMNNINKSLFLKGLDMMGHIFIILYTYTKHLELTAYHCRNAIVHYVEYISQITDKDDNIFFNLSLKDAIIYVYTKTIYSISETKRQNINFYTKENNILKNLHNHIILYIEIIRRITTSEEFTNLSNNDKENWLKLIQDELFTYAERRILSIKSTDELLEIDISLSPGLVMGLEEFNNYLKKNVFTPETDFIKLRDIIRLH
tara:strand:+ start:35 stop:808 length:774 start_codon:yes stop_codon:yes gene_type:complete